MIGLKLKSKQRSEIQWKLQQNASIAGFTWALLYGKQVYYHQAFSQSSVLPIINWVLCGKEFNSGPLAWEAKCITTETLANHVCLLYDKLCAK